MRKAPVLAIALLLSVGLPLVASANAITDPSTVNQEVGAPAIAFESLLDVGGLPFLLSSGSTLFQLSERQKLRYWGRNAYTPGDDVGGFGASDFSSGGGGGGTGDNGGGSGGSGGGAGDPLDLTGNDDGGGGSGGSGGGGGDDQGGLGDGGDGGSGGGGGTGAARVVPEPATLMLLLPAALLRRRLVTR
jgi:hypothetical protein